MDLFGKYLERLEQDYNSEDYNGNLVEKVRYCSSIEGGGPSVVQL